jgi:hypothetical protein
MPKQNPLTRLDAVAAGLGHMAEELRLNIPRLAD